MNSIAGFICSLRALQTNLVRGDECHGEFFLNAMAISSPLANENGKRGKPYP